MTPGTLLEKLERKARVGIQPMRGNQETITTTRGVFNSKAEVYSNQQLARCDSFAVGMTTKRRAVIDSGFLRSQLQALPRRIDNPGLRHQPWLATVAAELLF